MRKHPTTGLIIENAADRAAAAREAADRTPWRAAEARPTKHFKRGYTAYRSAWLENLPVPDFTEQFPLEYGRNAYRAARAKAYVDRLIAKREARKNRRKRELPSSKPAGGADTVLDRIVALIPRHLPKDMRDEIAQEAALLHLLGDGTGGDLRLAVERAITKVQRLFPKGYANMIAVDGRDDLVNAAMVERLKS